MSDTYNQALGSRSVSIWPTVWKFTLILAVFKLAYGLLTQVTGLAGTVPGLGLLGFVISVVLLVMALRSFRGQNGGYMTFGQGFAIAFVASVVSTVAAAALQAIYLSMAGEAILAAQRETALDQVRANPAVDAETLEMMQSFFGAVFTPGGMFLSAAIAGTFGWTIVSLILAAVVKKPPPISD